MQATQSDINLERLRRWDEHFRETYLDTGLLPGSLTLVYRRGETVYQSVQGWADAEKERPLEADSLFRIYSMTKPLTSLAFMMLVEEGRVSLNDPVSSLIPEWAGLGVYAGEEAGQFITTPPTAPLRMLDLLRHTAGLSYFIQQGGKLDGTYRKLGVGQRTTLDGFITELAALPLEFSPGEAWLYSAATDVLGYLIGKIAGQPFEQFLQQRVLTPLGMHDTGFEVPPEKASRLTTCYSLTPQGRQVFDSAERSRYLAPPHFVSGGGGLVSTAGDYLRFCRLLLRGGELDGVRLLGPKTLELMTRNHLPGGQDIAAMTRSPIAVSETASAGVGFGLGFAVTLDPVKTTLAGNAGDFFWGGAAGTYFWVDPLEDLAVIFMTQSLFSPDRVRQTLRTMVYAALDETPTAHTTKA